MKLKLLFACTLLFAVGLVAAPSASALPLVTPTVTPLSDGTYQYSWLLQNTDPVESIFDFGLFYYGAVDDTTVTDPTGWSHVAPGYDETTGLGYIDWLSPMLADGSTPYDLLAGATLGGFSFISSFAPGPITFTVNGALFDVGSTTGPNAVPEPATLLLLGTGAIGLFSRRRRSQPHA